MLFWPSNIAEIDGTVTFWLYGVRMLFFFLIDVDINLIKRIYENHGRREFTVKVSYAQGEGELWQMWSVVLLYYCLPEDGLEISQDCKLQELNEEKVKNLFELIWNNQAILQM